MTKQPKDQEGRCRQDLIVMSILLKDVEANNRLEKIVQSLDSEKNVSLMCGHDSVTVEKVDVSGPLLACHSPLVRSILSNLHYDHQNVTLVLPDFEAEVVSALLLPLLIGVSVQVSRHRDFQQMTQLLDLLGITGVYGSHADYRDQIIWQSEGDPYDDKERIQQVLRADADLVTMDVKNEEDDSVVENDDEESPEEKEEEVLEEDTEAGGTPAYQCTICEKSLRDKEQARQHATVHFKIPQVQCVTCGKSYLAKSAGQYHLRRAHAGQASMVPVNIDKLKQVMLKFFKKFDDNSIEERQNDENIFAEGGPLPDQKPFNCPKCAKTFESQDLLLAHHHYSYQVCQPPKLECNICEICGYEAPNPSKLARHQNTHMETSKFKCLQCNKAFTMAQALKFHMHIHTGEKPFVCELCGQRFLWKRALDAHVLGVHEKLNRYSCAICGAKYRNRLNVRRHLVSHFSIPQYACTVCRTEFMVASTCSKHIKKTHNGSGNVTVTNSAEWKELADKHIVLDHSRKKVKLSKEFPSSQDEMVDDSKHLKPDAILGT